MWQKVNNIIGKPSSGTASHKRDLNQLSLGSVIEFTQLAPAGVAGMRAQVSAIRTYRFASETTLTYAVTLTNGERYFISVAHDEEGVYLGIMRELSSAEQRQWFDPDALSFFTEPSSAKTLRCRADLQYESGWAAERYKKAVDFLVGCVSEGRQAATEIGRKPRRIEYSMLLDESGERAIEIEVYPEHGNVRLFATRFCPEEALTILPENAAFETQEQSTELSALTGTKEKEVGVAKILSMPVAQSEDLAKESQTHDDDEVLGELAAAIQGLNKGLERSPDERIESQMMATDNDPALFEEDVQAYLAGKTSSVSTRSVTDFRRLSESQNGDVEDAIQEDISPDDSEIMDEDTGPIPAFLLEPREPENLLEEILQPEALRLCVDSKAAYRMLHRAIKSRKPMKEMIREVLGLASSVRDEVIFELPLTARERQALAIHFQIRPDKPEELEARILKEITKRLS